MDQLRKRRVTGCKVIQTSGTDYGQGADAYAAHRRIHTAIFEELCTSGHLGSVSTVLEVGCGTGNYVLALARRFGCVTCGLEPSAAMLHHARRQPGRVLWVLGHAEQLCFADRAFDLIFSVDVIHHIPSKVAFFQQAARALRLGGRLCTVTDSEDFIRRREVLSGYFPETVRVDLDRYPRLTQLEAWMSAAGLADIQIVTVEQPYEITSAQPFRDKAYSCLQLISEKAWQAGIDRLEQDLASGPIRGAQRYACVWGRKAGK
jgi:SAM-dependent methyltransferase